MSPLTGRVGIEDRVITAIKAKLLNPELVELLVEKVNEVIRSKLGRLQAEQNDLVAKRNRTAAEIQNLVNYINRTGTAPDSIATATQEKEQELAALDYEISRSNNRQLRDVQVEPSYVTHWLNCLKELIDKDISAARVEIGKLIGELTAVPVSQNGQTGVMLSGKLRFDGVLGVVSGVSTLNNGGGRI